MNLADVAEVVFLTAEIGSNVTTHQTEERGDGEGFIAVSDDIEIDEVAVEAD